MTVVAPTADATSYASRSFAVGSRAVDGAAAEARTEVRDRLDVGDDQAVVVEYRAHVGVREALGVGALPVRKPEADAREAAGGAAAARARKVAFGSVPEHNTRSPGPSRAIDGRTA